MKSIKCILHYWIFSCVCHKNIWTIPSVFLWLQICVFIGFYLEFNAIWTQIWHQNLHAKFWLAFVCIILWLQLHLKIWRPGICLFPSANSCLQQMNCMEKGGFESPKCLLWSSHFLPSFGMLRESSVNSSSSFLPQHNDT